MVATGHVSIEHLKQGQYNLRNWIFHPTSFFIILHLNVDSRIWQWDTLLDNTVPVYSLWIFLIVTVANTYW